VIFYSFGQAWVAVKHKDWTVCRTWAAAAAAAAEANPAVKTKETNMITVTTMASNEVNKACKVSFFCSFYFDFELDPNSNVSSQRNGRLK
jgi:hypothetical protein